MCSKSIKPSKGTYLVFWSTTKRIFEDRHLLERILGTSIEAQIEVLSNLVFVLLQIHETCLWFLLFCFVSELQLHFVTDFDRLFCVDVETEFHFFLLTLVHLEFSNTYCVYSSSPFYLMRGNYYKRTKEHN